MSEVLNSTAENNFKKDKKASSQINSFFSPKSVAIIGASSKPGNQGGRIVKSLQTQGYPGQITLVHPKGPTIDSLKQVKTIEDLPEGIDLAIAALPAVDIPALIKPLAEKNIRHIIVISGGFSETGEQGETLQKNLESVCHEFGVQIIGPNCLGVFSASDHFNSFFLSPKDISFPEPGPVGILSQSGAFTSLILDRFSHLEIGVKRAVNFGNRAGIGENELLEFFMEDPQISVIGLYLEGFQNGIQFLDIARKVNQKKPIVIWKGGHFKEGKQAAKAHSASLASSIEVFRAACKKTGIIEVFGFEEFVQAIQILTLQPVPKGPNVLLVSNGGGMGVYLTDLCQRYGLKIKEPTQPAKKILQSFLPHYFSIQNPIDLTGSGTNQQCVQTVETLLQSGEYDSLLMVLLSGTEGINSDIADKLLNKIPKHIPLVFVAYGKNLFPSMEQAFSPHRIPVFSSAEAAAQSLSVLTQRAQYLKFPPGSKDDFLSETSVTEWPWDPQDPVDEIRLKEHLRNNGIEVPQNEHLKNQADLKNAIHKLGFPIVLKAIQPEIKHKLELKGIRLGIQNEKELFKAWQEMNQSFPEKIWAEEQIPEGLDVMVGIHQDLSFGPVLVFGTGGHNVELINDINRVILPASEDELINLIRKTSAGKIIEGYRDQPPLNRGLLIAFLKQVEKLMIDTPHLESLDFNPIRLFKNRLVVLDAKCTLLK